MWPWSTEFCGQEVTTNVTTHGKNKKLILKNGTVEAGPPNLKKKTYSNEV